MIISNEWFSMDVNPARIHPYGDCTDDVLIDLNGKREQYAIAYQTIVDGKRDWWFYWDDAEKVLEKDHAKWSYLPLRRYDK